MEPLIQTARRYPLSTLSSLIVINFFPPTSSQIPHQAMAVSSSSNDPSQYPGFQPLYQSQSQPAQTDHDAAAPAAAAAANGSGEGSGNYVPRPKRIACVVCRRRKLKCDGKKPSCGTCSRLGHACAYDEVRKKSGPKRGYVKQLEARLGMTTLSLCFLLGFGIPV